MSTSEDGTFWQMTPNQVKAVGITAMFIVAVIGAGVVPILLKNGNTQCAAGDAFSAGVLLIIGLMHLLPEAEEALTGLHHLAGGICCFTYLIMLVVHHAALKFYLSASGAQEPTKSDCEDVENGGACENRDCCVTSSLALESDAKHPSATSTDRLRPDFRAKKSRSTLVPCGHAHEVDDADTEERRPPNVGAVCLFVALGFHCVVEGFSAGAPSDAKTAGVNCLAIIAHKGFAGFALGQSILNADYGIRVFIPMVSFFAMSSPIGLAIGWACKFESHSTGVGVANAIAAGTFLSVACAEVIPELFRKNDRFLQKCIGILTGAGLMLLMLMLMPDEHADAH